jgi:hypothetical protein
MAWLYEGIAGRHSPDMIAAIRNPTKIDRHD